jgi:predicted site-specific integrase-resolvase
MGRCASVGTMHNDLALPRFLGSAEVCELIGIDRSTLTRWIQTDKIRPAQQLPGPKGVYLFTPDEVERAKAAYEARSTESAAS